MIFLTVLPPACSAVLLFTLAILLVRGPFRQYPLLLAYCGTELAISLGEGLTLNSVGVKSILYRYVYWSGDVLHDLMLFLLVITLTYRVMEDNPLRQGIGRMLAIIAVAAAALPFVVYHPYFTGRWFRHTSQLLGLGAAFMNLLLWTAVIGRKGNRDHQLLTVSTGVGIVVTGLAVSYGLLQFMKSDSVRWLPDLFKALTQVGCYAIWCRAFWPATGRYRTRHPMVEQPQV